MDVGRVDEESAFAALDSGEAPSYASYHSSYAYGNEQEDTVHVNLLAEMEDPGLPPEESEWEPEEPEEPSVAPAPAAAQSSTVAKTALLCGALIVVAIYESLCKKKAVKEAEFDLASVIVMNAVASILGGGLAALGTGEAKAAFGNPKTVGLQVLRYAPIGFLFTVGGYVQLLALNYLAADVFKVLEQSRLLLTAVFAMLLFGKRISTSSWVALVSITLVVVIYVQARHGSDVHYTVEKTFEHFMPVPNVDKAALPEAALLEAAPEHVRRVQAHVRRVLRQDTVAEHFTETVMERGIMSSSSNPLGYLLTGIFVLLSCAAGIYSEATFKHGGHTPFYVQKVYLEIPAGIWAVLVSKFVRPLLVDAGIAENRLTINMFDNGFFYGWSNPWVIAVFAMWTTKSWLAGLITKQLSSLSKQLCGITAVVLLYFVSLVHVCPDANGTNVGAPGTPLFCPSHIWEGKGSASFGVVVADMAVLASVGSYLAAQRDKARKQMWKKKGEEVKTEVNESQRMLSRAYYPA